MLFIVQTTSSIPCQAQATRILIINVGIDFERLHYINIRIPYFVCMKLKLCKILHQQSTALR